MDTTTDAHTLASGLAPFGCRNVTDPPSKKQKLSMNLSPLKLTRIFSEDEDDGCNSDNSFVSLEGANQFEQSNSTKATEEHESQQDELEDGNETDDEVEEEDDAFSGEANPSLVTQVIKNYINSNRKAPTFKDFTSIYYDYELAKKKAVFRKSGHTNFKTFCEEVRSRRRKVFCRKFPSQSYPAHVRRASAKKHRNLKGFYIKQLINIVNVHLEKTN